MLSYFGHIARRKGNNLEKVIMQGMIEGKRRKGRPRTRWIDQKRSAIGLSLRDCYALAEDRHLWRRMYEVTSYQPWQELANEPTKLDLIINKRETGNDTFTTSYIIFAKLIR